MSLVRPGNCPMALLYVYFRGNRSENFGQSAIGWLTAILRIDIGDMLGNQSDYFRTTGTVWD